MLWEYEHGPISKYFHSFYESPHTLTSVSTTRYKHRKNVSQFFQKRPRRKKENHSFKFFVLTPLLRQQFVLVVLFYRDTCKCVFSGVF